MPATLIENVGLRNHRALQLIIVGLMVSTKSDTAILVIYNCSVATNVMMMMMMMMMMMTMMLMVVSYCLIVVVLL